MSRSNLDHLFTPGTGAVPPYLAGRKEEQAYFQGCVETLKKQKPVPRNLIVYGPRGNGKTTLYSHLQKKTLQEEGDRLTIQWTTPTEINTLVALATRLIGGNQSLWNRLKTKMDLSSPNPNIRTILLERSQDKPYILIIDEAHRLQPKLAGRLLNASQRVRGGGGLFLLVLVGTPQLTGTLRRSEAGFWERGEIVRLGRLSPQEAGEAITLPLQKEGIAFASDVIETVVEQTDCYPYFIQVWGDCLARRLAETGETEIALETVKAVKAEIIGKCHMMFRIRRNEINDMGLRAVAESVANAFIQIGAPTLHESILKEAIGYGLADDEPNPKERTIKAFYQLADLGYIWPVGYYGDYEPGLPSLMAFVQGASRSRTRGKD